MTTCSRKLNLTEPEMIWYKSFDGRAHSGLGAAASGFPGGHESIR